MPPPTSIYLAIAEVMLMTTDSSLTETPKLKYRRLKEHKKEHKRDLRHAALNILLDYFACKQDQGQNRQTNTATTALKPGIACKQDQWQNRQTNTATTALKPGNNQIVQKSFYQPITHNTSCT
ncbi:hypothetical protein LXL04_011537 [Taraxacum kok-saghyz]